MVPGGNLTNLAAQGLVQVQYLYKSLIFELFFIPESIYYFCDHGKDIYHGNNQ